MDTDTRIRLRLRFYKDVEENTKTVQEKFKKFSKKTLDGIKINACDNHVWFSIIGIKKHYWSPHLHLQLEPKNENQTHIRGLFGADQTLWTFFMFLHFIVAGIFTVFGMIAYSNFTLKQPYTMNLAVIAMMIFVWFLLYFIARQIRWKGQEQMNELERLFLKIVEE